MLAELMQNGRLDRHTYIDRSVKAPFTCVSKKICRRQQRREADFRVYSNGGSSGKSKDAEESGWKLPMAGKDTDWREYRARLIAAQNAMEAKKAQDPVSEKPQESQVPQEPQEPTSNLWAHPIAAPEQGCLLLAHPLMFSSSQTYFHQAVILITSHDEAGTAGVILNKPLEHLIGQLSGAEDLMPEFSQNRLFLGGDVGGQTSNGNVLQLLHDQKQLANSVEIVNGIYLGGFQAAKMAVRREEIDAVKTCRWYCRFAGWAPGQLQSECERGVWFTAAASKDMILHPSCLENGQRHWHTVMQSMGGEYKQVSEALLVEPELREEVWGKKNYIKSVQPEVSDENQESP